MIQEGVRQSRRFAVDSVETWRQKALHWASARFEQVVFFQGNAALTNSLSYPHGPFPDRLAAGSARVVPFSEADPFDTLVNFHRQHPDFLVGYWGYDLKNRIEALATRHPDRTGFPDQFFFQPLHLIDFLDDSVVIHSLEDPEGIWRQITKQPSGVFDALSGTPSVQCRVSREQYVQTVKRIQEHIREGDIYELNYCIEFFAEGLRLPPLEVYRRLNERSPMPFSCFFRNGDQYVLCASPERFLKKDGTTLISQPIKGTIRRGTSPEEDVLLRQQLRCDEKEQAENLMIVDLVRNDLARSAETGSVRVEELFGIYGFRQVHQMISTVTARLRADVSFGSVIRNAFPMGSMTGAPKVRAMELIDRYESSRRGVYSGAMGFITPGGDFDFNVVIRSLIYNAANQYASFSVGSAITYDADPEREYAECLLKARAVREALMQGER